ncbi:hypothetical protein U1Q18_038007, partial [Sarracenia purpurea var. burkii]
MPPTAMMQRRSGPFPFSLQLLRPSLALNWAGLTIDGWVWWKRGWSALPLRGGSEPTPHKLQCPKVGVGSRDLTTKLGCGQWLGRGR